VNELQEIRDALDRTEKNLERFRWLITHPIQAREALRKAIVIANGKMAIDVVVYQLDLARKV